MILVRWNDRWFLASKARPDTPSCALVAGDWPELAGLGFVAQERSVGKPGDPGFRAHYVWHRRVADMAGVVCYPTLRFKGMPVHPEYWHHTASEPILHCMLRDISSAVDAECGVTMAMVHEADRTGDRERWLDLCKRREAASQRVRRRLLDEGWEQVEAGMYGKHLHIDELEKIEGPPPDGPF